jgi:hypothetical protein
MFMCMRLTSSLPHPSPPPPPQADWQYEFGTTLSTVPDGKFPNVMSISYAWYELDQCDISPSVAPCTGVPVPAGSKAFVIACNQLYAKAGSRGMTLISASGDSGAHGRYVLCVVWCGVVCAQPSLLVPFPPPPFPSSPLLSSPLLSSPLHPPCPSPSPLTLPSP